MSLPRFDEDSWQQIATFLEHLVAPVEIHIWGDEMGSWAEKEAIGLAALLADEFDDISYRAFPRRLNYPYYPVMGIMRLEGEERIDHGVRCIGLPQGYQITSLIAALQGVAFQGQQLEPVTRIKLHRLQKPVELQVLTMAEDEAGAAVASLAYYFAAAHPLIKSYTIMADTFPEAATRYSASYLPHVVINNRFHISGAVDEEGLLQKIAESLAI